MRKVCHASPFCNLLVTHREHAVRLGGCFVFNGPGCLCLQASPPDVWRQLNQECRNSKECLQWMLNGKQNSDPLAYS